MAVRDSGTAAFFDSNLPVVLDPTMLLDVEEWNKLAGDSPLIKGEYVFYYDPFDHEVGKNAAREYAVEHGYRIVSSNIYMIFQKDTRTFDYRLDAGPLEFLNFVKYAKYCIGRSFHLCVFSLLFRKEFQMADGLIDARNRELAESLWGDVERLSKAGDNDMIVSATDYTAEVETTWKNISNVAWTPYLRRTSRIGK